MNLGRDPVKFRASRPSQQLANGEWHKVVIKIRHKNVHSNLQTSKDIFTKKGKDCYPYLSFLRVEHFLQRRKIVKSGGTFSLSRKDFVLWFKLGPIFGDLSDSEKRIKICFWNEGKISYLNIFFIQVDLQLNQNNGRITIDGDLELFTTQGRKRIFDTYIWNNQISNYYLPHSDSDSLDLSGSLFVGGIDYLDPALSPPPQIWSTALKMGFVGCLKDLIINGADIDIVAYAHEQNSGVWYDKF